MLSFAATHREAAQRTATVGIVDAVAPMMILGRVAGIPESDLASAAANGSQATVVDAALERLGTK